MAETAREDRGSRILAMDSEERVDRRQELARTLARGGMEGVAVLSHESAAMALTEKRRELVEVLLDVDVESVRALARRVDRDKAQVSRDLAVLSKHGIVAYEDAGREKRPFLKPDHLVVEPFF